MRKRAQAAEFIRKNPKQDRAAATLQAILDATAHILETDGTSKLSTNRIALVAGVSVGAIYQYFSNREAILLALARQHNARLRDGLHEAMARRASLTLDASVRAIVRMVLAAYADAGTVQQVILRESLLDRENSGSGEVMREIGALLLEKLGDGTRAEIRQPSPERVFAMLYSLIGAISYALLFNSELLRSPAFEDELVRMVMLVLKD